ncbi:MAG: hypothetical protein ACOZAL_02860 [Patescibacteria group bacterium]
MKKMGSKTTTSTQKYQYSPEELETIRRTQGYMWGQSPGFGLTPGEISNMIRTAQRETMLPYAEAGRRLRADVLSRNISGGAGFQQQLGLESEKARALTDIGANIQNEMALKNIMTKLALLSQLSGLVSGKGTTMTTVKQPADWWYRLVPDIKVNLGFGGGGE